MLITGNWYVLLHIGILEVACCTAAVQGTKIWALMQICIQPLHLVYRWVALNLRFLQAITISLSSAGQTKCSANTFQEGSWAHDWVDVWLRAGDWMPVSQFCQNARKTERVMTPSIKLDVSKSSSVRTIFGLLASLSHIFLAFVTIPSVRMTSTKCVSNCPDSLLCLGTTAALR